MEGINKFAVILHHLIVLIVALQRILSVEAMLLCVLTFLCPIRILHCVLTARFLLMPFVVVIRQFVVISFTHQQVLVVLIVVFLKTVYVVVPSVQILFKQFKKLALIALLLLEMLVEMTELHVLNMLLLILRHA